MVSGTCLLLVYLFVHVMTTEAILSSDMDYSNAIRNAETLLRQIHRSPQDGNFDQLQVLMETEHFFNKKTVKDYAHSISEFIKKYESHIHTEHPSPHNRHERSAGDNGNPIENLLRNSNWASIFKASNISSPELRVLLGGLVSSLAQSRGQLTPQVISSLLSALQNGNAANLVPELVALLPTLQKFLGNNTYITGLINVLKNNPNLVPSIQQALSSSLANSTLSMLTGVTSALSKAPVQCRNDMSAMFSSIGNGQGWALSMLDAFGKPSAGLKQGRTKWWGDYDECISIKSTNTTPEIQGNYCKMSTFVSGFKVLGQGVTIDQGLCMPRSCDNDTIKNIFFPVLLSLSQNLPNNIRLYVYKVQCQKQDLSLDGKAIVMVIICSLFLIMMAFGTLYDVYLERKKNTMTASSTSSGTETINDPGPQSADFNYRELHKEGAKSVPNGMSIQQPAPQTTVSPDILGRVLLCFSVYTNGRKLLNTTQSPGSLTSLHGIRFLSMAWVILGHTLALNFQIMDNMTTETLPNLYTSYLNLQIMDNLGYVGPKWVSWTSFQAVENALVSVDTFFAISGLLVSYLLLKEMKKLGGPLKTNWFMFYFHRFWRTRRLRVSSIGGLTSFISMTNMDNNLVYPNGDAGGGCIAWTWYLANDMQFYILSPLLIVPFYFGAPFGFASSFVFLITTWGATGGLGHKYQWPPTQLGGGPDTSHQGEMFSKYYVKPYCRMGPYIMGVITGYLLYHTQCKLKIRWYLNILGWAMATLFASLVLYGLHDAMNGSPLKENVAILYLTTHRTVWGACVCWVVFACVTGNGGPINTLLSWEGFVPLSRLTYCAYLVHPIVMEVYEGSLRHPLDFTILTFSFLFIGYLVCAMSIAFIVSLAFEAPMMGLEKIVLPKGGEKPNAKGGNESNGQTVPNLPIAVLSVNSPTVENVKM